MINEIIKTEAQAKKAAEQMAQDLRGVLEIFTEYQVEMHDDKVTIKSDTNCPILTSSVVVAAFNVIEWYSLKYVGVSYWIGWVKGTHQEFIPTIEIQFYKTK